MTEEKMARDVRLRAPFTSVNRGFLGVNRKFKYLPSTRLRLARIAFNVVCQTRKYLHLVANPDASSVQFKYPKFTFSAVGLSAYVQTPVPLRQSHTVSFRSFSGSLFSSSTFAIQRYDYFLFPRSTKVLQTIVCC